LDPLSEEGVIKCIIKNIPLAADNYFLDVNIKIDEEFSDYVQNAAKLVIQDGDFFNTGRILPKKLGSSLVHGTWLNA
jgi:lipopolysaccharide transport system ATP-binding protein